MFVSSKSFQPGLMFAGKARAYLNEAPFRCSTQGLLLYSPTKIRLGSKGLPWTNTLAYYENPYITAVKKFYSTGPRIFKPLQLINVCNVILIQNYIMLMNIVRF